MADKYLTQLGQLFMIGLAGPKLSAKEKSFLKRVKPAGVIYFRRNIKNPKQITALSASIRKLIPSALIGIDQEGGRVARLGPPFTVFPGNDFLGRHYLRTKSQSLAARQARAMAEELKAIGANINFTPVADIHSNPRNPIIGTRAFGASPKTVATLVAATVKAYKKAKIISCAKHFPGHGDSFADSHKVLPVVRASRATLNHRELVPFRAAIRAGVPTLMTAHIVYPALDKKNPATLSKVILENLLRKKLKFRGVIISDDLEMNAIARHQSAAEAAVDAIAAGVDLLLVCKSLDLANDVFKKLHAAIRAGHLDVHRVKSALSRVEKLKKDYASGLGGRLHLRMPQRGWARHQDLAQKIEKAGF